MGSSFSYHVGRQTPVTEKVKVWKQSSSTPEDVFGIKDKILVHQNQSMGHFPLCTYEFASVLLMLSEV